MKNLRILWFLKSIIRNLRKDINLISESSLYTTEEKKSQILEIRLEIKDLNERILEHLSNV